MTPELYIQGQILSGLLARGGKIDPSYLIQEAKQLSERFFEESE